MSWTRDELYPLAKIGINSETCKYLEEKVLVIVYLCIRIPYYNRWFCALQMHLLFAGAFQMRQNYVPELFGMVRDYRSTITSNKLGRPA